MKAEKIPEPVGKMIIDSGLGEMTQNGLYVHYKDVITLMKKYSNEQNKDISIQLETVKYMAEKANKDLIAARG